MLSQNRGRDRRKFQRRPCRTHVPIQQPVQRETFVGETETVGAESVVAFGDFVLDLQGISDDGLSRAIFVVRRLLRGLKPRGVLLADFHYSLRERCHDERFGDFTPQLAGAIVHFGLAHRGLPWQWSARPGPRA